MKKIKKLILYWLFGTDDIQEYLDLLRDCMQYCQALIDTNELHIETLKKEKESLEIIRKLIKVCKKHGINDIDEELYQIDMEENFDQINMDEFLAGEV